MVLLELPMRVMATLRTCSGGTSVQSRTLAGFYLLEETEATVSGDFECAAESLRFFILLPLEPDMRAEFLIWASPSP